MFPALVFTLRSLCASLLSKDRLSGPIHPQAKVISLGRDELPDYLLRDLGIFDGNRSDRESCHPAAASRPSRRQVINLRLPWLQEWGNP
jgi:hypothetical protein